MTTIIRMKYAEINGQIGHDSDTSRTVSELFQTANKNILININCNIGLIIDYIREVVHLGETVEFDLWEESTSQLMNISSHKTHASGLEVFRPNNTYFLITMERDSNGQIVNCVPMISGKQSRTLSEMMGKMKRLTRKSSSGKFQDNGGRRKSQGKSK